MKPEYDETFEALSPEEKGYELARRGFSSGMSGFHGADFFDDDLPTPFAFCGWAGQHSNYVGFRIEQRCFGGRDVQLYYFNDDSWPRADDERTLKVIRDCSSGLADVHYERRVVKAYAEERARTLIVFRLSADTIRETVMLNSKEVPSREAGGYVFVLPRCGEFMCELGEMLDGELVPLHRDSFCMK